jgi:hypothetical protein
MAMSKPRGPVPKREDQRRRDNKPESHGAASVDTAEAGERPDALGFDADPMIVSLWDALADSAESKYYSAADWQRVRLELLYGNRLLSGGRIGSQAWGVFQAGLNELLISPADKRRAGIELKPPSVDPDEEAAVAQISDYRNALESA